MLPRLPPMLSDTLFDEDDSDATTVQAGRQGPTIIISRTPFQGVLPWAEPANGSGHGLRHDGNDNVGPPLTTREGEGSPAQRPDQFEGYDSDRTSLFSLTHQIWISEVLTFAYATS